MSDLNPATSHLLYEVDDNPPLSVSLPLAGQTIALILAGITLTPIIALTAAGIVDVWGQLGCVRRTRHQRRDNDLTSAPYW